MRSTLLLFTAPVLTAVMSMTLSNAAFAKVKSAAPKVSAHQSQARTTAPESAPAPKRLANSKAKKPKLARPLKKSARMGKKAHRKTAAHRPRASGPRELGSNLGKTKITRLPNSASPKLIPPLHNSAQHFRSRRA